MAAEVIWTEPALYELNQVYEYYRKHHSESSAVKVFNSILDTADSLSTFPYMGLIEQQLSNRQECYRSLIEGHFKIVYYIKESKVYIALLWDCRQNPIHLFDKI